MSKVGHLTISCALASLLIPVILCAGPAFFLSTECMDGALVILAAAVIPSLLMFARSGRCKEQVISLWSGLYLYMFILIFLMRETFIMAFGRIPCGFGMQPCTKSECAWYMLGFICMREECVEHSNSGGSYEFSFAYHKSLGWMLGALIPAWISYCVCVLHDAEWRWYGPEDRGTASYGKIILAVPVTYAVCGLHVFRILMVNPKDDWASDSTMCVAELYSALGLAAFLEICLISVRTKEYARLEQSESRMRRESLSQCKLGVRIYLWSALLLNALQTLAKMINWWSPEKCDKWLPAMYNYYFPHSKLQLVGHTDQATGYGQNNFKPACADLWSSVNAMFYPLNFVLCVVALLSLISLQSGMEEGLKHIRPHLKFWAIKLALVVAFWMSFALWALDFFNVLPQGTENRLFASAFLVVAISPAFALFHRMAYSTSDFPTLPFPFDAVTGSDDPLEAEMDSEFAPSSERPSLLGKAESARDFGVTYGKLQQTSSSQNVI